MPRQLTAEDTPQRTYASGVSLTLFDLMVLQVDACPAKAPGSDKASAMKLICPECSTPSRVRQQYVCDHDGHGPFTERDLQRARELDDGSLVRVTPEEVLEAKVGDAIKNETTITPHPLDQVMGECRPGGLNYRLRPPSKGTAKMAQLYATVHAIIRDTPDVAWVGELRLRDKRSLYRLEAWGGQLVLSELIRPDDLAPVDVIAAEPDQKAMLMMSQLIEPVDFDPEMYRWDVKARVDEMVEGREGSAPAKPADKGGDLVDMLEAALAAKAKKGKGRKPTAKTERKAS